MNNTLMGRALFAVLSAWALSALAAPAEPISLAEAVGRTLAASPVLAVFPHRLRIADGQLVQAGVDPGMALSVEAENLGTSGAAAGLGETELTLSLSRLIELGSKRERRLRVAALSRDDAQLDYEIARLDVLGEAVSRYIDLAEAQAAVDLARRGLELTAADRAGAALRVEAGAAPRADLLRLDIARQQADLELRRAEMARRNASQRLASLWGENGETGLRAAAPLMPLPALPALGDIQSRLAGAPRLRQFASRERLEQAQLRLAEANGRRDLTLSLGARHDGLDHDNSLLLGISVPLHLADPNRGHQASARAALAATAAEAELARVELLAVLDSAYRALQLAREAFAVVSGQSLPLASQLGDEIGAGYRAGRYSVLDLGDARREQLTLERQALALAADFHRHYNELERLTGEQLVAAGERTP
ncbi:MAG: TolC family protein [Porticoccaceae bacterium]